MDFGCRARNARASAESTTSGTVTHAAQLIRVAATEEENMTKALVLFGASAVAVVASTGATAGSSDSELARPPAQQIRRLSLELVGQFQNSPPSVMPPTHVHYGYLSYIRGLSVFRGAAQNETTALFTFFSDAATPRVIPERPAPRRHTRRPADDLPRSLDERELRATCVVS